MCTLWKKMTALGFGLAFVLLSSTAVLADGGEGFDFTDEKSASEERAAMEKQKKEEENRPVIIDASEIDMYIEGLVADMEKLFSTLVRDDVTEWQNTRQILQSWEDAPFKIHGVRGNQVRNSTNQEKKILYEGCELIDKFVRRCLMQYWVALDWRKRDIAKQLEATVAMENWFESMGVEHMKELTSVQKKLFELYGLCQTGKVRNADLGLMDVGLHQHFVAPDANTVFVLSKGSFLYDLDAHAKAMTKEIIDKRLAAIQWKEDELEVARKELRTYAPKLKGLPRPFAKAAALIPAVEKIASLFEEILEEYQKMLLLYADASDPRGQFVLKRGSRFEFKSGEGYADAVIRTVKESLSCVKN